jgi:hypothetical protein
MKKDEECLRQDYPYMHSEAEEWWIMKKDC